jgi:hypothetical protein
MTAAERTAYLDGHAAQRRGEPCPAADGGNSLAWAFWLGWMAASFGWEGR